MTVDKVLYFAYGSNMNFNQMKERCPGSRFISKGYLEGFEFVFDGYSKRRNGAVANVIKKEGSLVEGGIYEVTASDIKELDMYEGCPNTYLRCELAVRDQSNKPIKAFVYCRLPQPIGSPSEEYRNTILCGAKDCGLSNEYIHKYLKK
ncbi:MAG: gamma-glutamylcyclotransferase family protein [Thermoplasmatales archaeon]